MNKYTEHHKLMEMLMAWIQVIREDEAEGELKSTYNKMIEPKGG